MIEYRIGETATALGLSADTLRYYEKIGLLPPVARSVAGARRYAERDISRLKFIQRAQKMNFSLAEIGSLLQMREDPQNARREVRELTQHKLDEVEDQIQALDTLRRELQLLVRLCRGAKDGCPIIEKLDRQQPAGDRAEPRKSD